MNGFSLPVAYQRICTWSFENKADFLRTGHLIPSCERGLYDRVNNYEEPSRPTSPPWAASTVESPTVPLSHSTPPHRPALENSTFTAWTDINSIQNTAPPANPATPPEDPSTPPADRDTGGLFSFQSLAPTSSAEMASSSTTPQAHIPGHFPPAPEGFPGPGQLWLPTAACALLNIIPSLNAELLNRILSVPTLLSVTYLRGPHQGSTNYHYLLPPPPEVNPAHLDGGWVLPGRSMLPVDTDTALGLPRETWLDVGMDVVWEELMMSLIAEYAEFVNDIGLSAWEWRWVKTEWNKEMVCRQPLSSSRTQSGADL